MKWVLIYIIMTAEYGAASVVHEFDDEVACDFALSNMQNLESFMGEHEDISPLTFVTCLPKGSEVTK